MNEYLIGVIDSIKEKLESNPDAILIGQLEKGLDVILAEQDLYPKEYFDFLKICNGCRCGVIDLWNFQELPLNQFYFTELNQDRDVWVCIGQILYKPIAINKDDKEVYLFNQETEIDVPTKCFGEFEKFLINYVFGDRYKEIAPDYEDELWYQLLQNIDLK